MAWRDGDKPMRDDDGMDQKDPAIGGNGEPFDNSFNLLSDAEEEALHERVHDIVNEYLKAHWEHPDDSMLTDELRQSAACSSVALLDKLFGDTASQFVLDSDSLGVLIQACIVYGLRMKGDYDSGLLKFGQ